MRVSLRNLAELGAGALLITLGAIGLALSHDLPMRSGPRLGPGAMPLGMSVLVVLFGLALLVRGLLVAGPPPTGWRVRPALALTAAILGFALAVEQAGLVPACILLLVAAVAARPGIRWIEAAIYVPALTALTVLVFKYLLKQPLALWGA